MAELPDDVGRFIDSNLRSVTDLEILRILVAPEAPATAPALAQVLRISEAQASEGLAALRARGLVAQADDGRWAYTAADPTLDACVNWLASNFRTYRVAVTTRIYSHPSDKVTGLAEGFRLRRRVQDDDG